MLHSGTTTRTVLLSFLVLVFQFNAEVQRRKGAKGGAALVTRPTGTYAKKARSYGDVKCKHDCGVV